MFERIAKFRLLRARRVAHARSVPANRNLRGIVRPARRRPQLVCRWSFDQGPRCRWEIAGRQEAPPLLADEPPTGAFTRLSSYRRTTNRLRPASGNGPTVTSRPRPICCRHVTSRQ